MVRLQRSLGIGTKPRKRLPRQIPPRLLERDYARVLVDLIKEIQLELAPLIAEMPSLMLSAAADRRIDGPDAPHDSSVRRYDADEGKKIKEAAERAKARLKESISTSRLEKIAEKIGRQTSDYQKGQLTKSIKAAVGVELPSRDSKTGTLLEGFVQENVSLISGIPDRVVDEVATSITRAVRRGSNPNDLAKELSKKFGYEENRAKRIAQDQIKTLYAQVNIVRQKELGLNSFFWRTMQDERVRPEHAEREGKKYSYDDPPEGELPGEAINCRCYPDPDFSSILGDA